MSIENSGAQRVAGVSPSSILSLPNDLLHPIMQEVYDAGRSQPRKRPISQIMINKRIFAVARSTWFSRLAIAGPLADQHLAALEKDELRCQSLRHLLVKVEDFSHLIDVVQSRRFPKLAKLTIHFFDGTKQVPAWAIDKLISRMENLHHLEVHLSHYTPTSARNLIATTLSYPRLLSVSCFGKMGVRTRIGPAFRVEQQVPRDMSASSWAGLESFELRPSPFVNSNIYALLDSLETALDGSSGEVPTIPLRRLSLPLREDEDENEDSEDSSIEGLNSTDFTRLLRLLPNTAVEHLRFTAISMPTISEVPLARSVRVLKLSCDFNLEVKHHFSSLWRLVVSFPSLTHLHLIGERLFGSSTTLESLASDSDVDIFLHPELSTLLLWLRTSNVKVFTYRMREEDKREARWIRKGETPDENFETDCWTL